MKTIKKALLASSFLIFAPILVSASPEDLQAYEAIQTMEHAFGRTAGICDKQLTKEAEVEKNSAHSTIITSLTASEKRQATEKLKEIKKSLQENKQELCEIFEMTAEGHLEPRK